MAIATKDRTGQERIMKKKAVYTLLFAMGLFSGPAAANDFLATCKANPPTGMAADVYGKFCTCIDKESAGNDRDFAQISLKPSNSRRLKSAKRSAAIAQRPSPRSAIRTDDHEIMSWPGRAARAGWPITSPAWTSSFSMSSASRSPYIWESHARNHIVPRLTRSRRENRC